MPDGPCPDAAPRRSRRRDARVSSASARVAERAREPGASTPSARSSSSTARLASKKSSALARLEPAGAPADQDRGRVGRLAAVGSLGSVAAAQRRPGRPRTARTSAHAARQVAAAASTRPGKQRRAHHLVVRRDRVLDRDAVGQRRSASPPLPSARSQGRGTKPQVTASCETRRRQRVARAIGQRLGAGRGRAAARGQARRHAIVAGSRITSSMRSASIVMSGRKRRHGGVEPRPRRRARRGMLDRRQILAPPARAGSRSRPARCRPACDSDTRRGALLRG